MDDLTLIQELRRIRAASNSHSQNYLENEIGRLIAKLERCQVDADEQTLKILLDIYELPPDPFRF